MRAFGILLMGSTVGAIGRTTGANGINIADHWLPIQCVGEIINAGKMTSFKMVSKMLDLRRGQ